MLSPLQEQVARILAGVPESEGFALAGGAALIIRGDVERPTRDLDFFGSSALAVDRLVPVAEQALLAVDKLLALFGRAEARDFADLMAVAQRYGLDRLLDLAEEEDRGFDAGVLAEILTRIDRLPKAAFPLDDAQFAELPAAVTSWKERALDYAREKERIRGLRRDRGPDLGLGRQSHRGQEIASAADRRQARQAASATTGNSVRSSSVPLHANFGRSGFRLDAEHRSALLAHGDASVTLELDPTATAVIGGVPRSAPFVTLSFTVDEPERFLAALQQALTGRPRQAVAGVSRGIPGEPTSEPLRYT